jgi:acetylornithine deacetylase/succinyl-diaminopimelate desuccinylase-like protein
VCEAHRDELKADLFLASDGPRLSAERPTSFLGCRGGNRIHLDVNLREGGHHSGNWGGVLANPATILANAIASLVDGKGRMKLDALKPPRISNAVRAALADVKIEPTADEPALAPDWGEEGLSPAERLFAWNTLEVLAMSSGSIDKPANAIPGAPMPCCSSASSSAPNTKRSSTPCVRICMPTAFRWWRSAARSASQRREPMSTAPG